MQNVSSFSKDVSADSVLATWQRAGQFRLRNPAVGAGEQEKLSDNTFCRRFKDPSKNIDNVVVLHVGDTKKIEVGKCFADGKKVQDGMTGIEYTVNNGHVEGDFKKWALLEIARH